VIQVLKEAREVAAACLVHADCGEEALAALQFRLEDCGRVVVQAARDPLHQRPLSRWR
jgi:hypothetical protein